MGTTPARGDRPSVKRALTVALLLLSAAPALAAGPWGRVREVHPGPPEVIGGYAAGCLAGGATLARVGEGHQVMRPSRNRHYGHPRLVAFVERMGADVSRRGWGRVLVGDMAQPRGGPMDFGHRSHQSGLDVDLWFRLLPAGAPALSREEADDAPMLSVVDAQLGEIEGGRWSARYADLVRLAAERQEVERIFVHPVIKRTLCASDEGDRRWLRKVRPYWGHDAHFHVRLACPGDSPRCTPQEPVPEGDGCDEGLDRWIDEIRQAAANPPPRPPPPPRPAMPAACDAVLAGKPAPSLGAAETRLRNQTRVR